MPQSLSRILVHLVFSTKNREPFLSAELQADLHPYLAVTLDHIDCPSLRVGGTQGDASLALGLGISGRWS
jgi:hypothetical protein